MQTHTHTIHILFKSNHSMKQRIIKYDTQNLIFFQLMTLKIQQQYVKF